MVVSRNVSRWGLSLPLNYNYDFILFIIMIVYIVCFSYMDGACLANDFFYMQTDITTRWGRVYVNMHIMYRSDVEDAYFI